MTSYDDGTINDITLANTLTAYGMKATFNLNGRAFRKEAYNSLIYSADERIIYNPTLYDVFFDADGKTYCVESGKTITIGGN